MRPRSTSLFLAALALIWLPQSAPALNESLADEAARLARLLAEADATLGSAGRGALMIRRPDSRLEAIERLAEIGTREAVEGLLHFLTRPDADVRLKMQSLLALAHMGTPEAVLAIEQFEQWAESRRIAPPPFAFGPKEFAIYHFRPVDVQPASKATGPGETRWAIFQWDKFGRQHDQDGTADWWIARSLDGICWDQPLLVEGVGTNVPPDLDPAEFFLSAIRLGERKLDPFTLDSDGDGLTDLLEARLGTDLAGADSDRDGTPDGRDSNPLTLAGQVTGEKARIRQAVFTFLFATAGSEYPIYVVGRGEFARQEYRGHRGMLLRVPKVLPGRVNLVRFDVILESPTAAKVTLEDYEGNVAAAHHEAALRKLHGRWVVVQFRLLGIA